MKSPGNRNIDAANFTIGFHDTVSVTRHAGVDSEYVDFETGSLGAPVFLCNVFGAHTSPAFKRPTPMTSFLTSGANSGAILGQKEALYDPDTGVARFFVTASDFDSSFFNTDETWEFEFYLLYEKQ